MNDSVVGPVLLLGFFCLLGGIVSSIAAKKGRSPVAWFIFGACLFVPALVTAILIKPHRDHEVESWIRSGGRLCQDCREPINPGAIRCHRCGTLQSERAPEQLLEAWEIAPKPDAYERSIQFFAEELKNVGGSNVLGDLTLDERALLGPLGASARLSSERAQLRCQRLVDEAMVLAAETSQWAEVEGTPVPLSWVDHFRTIADTDDSLAIVAFIERSSVGNEVLLGPPGPGAPAKAAETEIAYDIAGWTPPQLAWITQALDHQRVPWSIDENELIVDPSDESTVDDLVAQMTGERPTNLTWQPPTMPPPVPPN